MVDFDRLEALIKAQGKKKAHLCALAGKGRGYISDAKNGNGSISDEALEVFAAELGTTAAYLRGETDEKKAPSTEAGREMGFDDFDYALRNESRALSEEKKQMLLNMARFMRQEEEKGK